MCGRGEQKRSRGPSKLSLNSVDPRRKSWTRNTVAAINRTVPHRKSMRGKDFSPQASQGEQARPRMTPQPADRGHPVVEMQLLAGAVRASSNAIAAASQVNSWRIAPPTAPTPPSSTCAVHRPNKSAPATTRHARCRLLAGSRACNSIRMSFSGFRPDYCNSKPSQPHRESPGKAINHVRRRRHVS